MEDPDTEKEPHPSSFSKITRFVLLGCFWLASGTFLLVFAVGMYARATGQGGQGHQSRGWPKSIPGNADVLALVKENAGREKKLANKKQEQLFLDSSFRDTLIYRKWAQLKEPQPSRSPMYIDKYWYDESTYNKVVTASDHTPPLPSRLVRWENKKQITIAMGPIFETGNTDNLAEFQTILEPFQTELEGIINADIVFTEKRQPNPLDETSLADITINMTRWRVEFPKRAIRTLVENPDPLDFYYSYEIPFGIRGTEISPKTERPKLYSSGFVKISPDYEIELAICNPHLGHRLSPKDVFFLECLFGALGVVNRENTPYDIQENLRLLRLLYSPNLKPGMTREEAVQALENGGE